MVSADAGVRPAKPAGGTGPGSVGRHSSHNTASSVFLMEREKAAPRKPGLVAAWPRCAVSPTSIRLAAHHGFTEELSKACGLEIRDTAGWNPALRAEGFCPTPWGRFPIVHTKFRLPRGCAGRSLCSVILERAIGENRKSHAKRPFSLLHVGVGAGLLAVHGGPGSRRY